MSSALAARAQRSPLVLPGEIQHHAADMAVTVAAVVTLGELQRQLLEAGQWLAIDGDPRLPLGRLIERDSTGPLRLGFGGWRDLLTGVQFTDGHGDLVTVGGVTVKNVAGYDLVKFLVGAHGCFGELVTFTCRTYRAPEAAIGVTLEEAIHITDLLATDSPPQWMLVTPDGLRAGWIGSAREMSALRPIIARLGNVEPRDLAEDEAQRIALLDVGPESARIITAPSEVAALLTHARPTRFAADPVFGVTWMASPPRFSDVAAFVRACGGNAICYGTDGVRTIGVAGATRRVLEKLKSGLDPSGRLPPLPKEE